MREEKQCGCQVSVNNILSQCHTSTTECCVSNLYFKMLKEGLNIMMETLWQYMEILCFLSDLEVEDAAIAFCVALFMGNNTVKKLLI